MIHFTVPRKFVLISPQLCVTRTRIPVTGVNFDQGKGNLGRVHGELELSKFKLTKLK